ncbi:secretory carrier-associated membrane protein 4 isoform X1 [Halichoeres trimaculatus]|uniref:secretory carrier-associated membrane protein 4 isoform X1 n=1 Tax=Halichoeres trimaculatus TaxID=147232 RepID=UPI003D9DD125
MADNRTNNFPPLPQFMRIKPCFYQNIEEEIPAPHQQLVYHHLSQFLFPLHLCCPLLSAVYSATLGINVISCIAWWAGGGNATNFGFSLLWVLLFSPCSYTCWFRPLYKAFRADSSFNFMAFFFVFFLQCVLALIQTIGISGWGTCGWIATVMFFSTNVGSAIVMLITALLFTAVTALMALVLIKVHRLYRGGGGSMQRAQEEWSTGMWKSAPVREAGFNAVAQTAQGPSLPQYPAAVPSYPDNSQW